MKSLSTKAAKVLLKPPPKGNPVALLISSRVNPLCRVANKRTTFLLSSGLLKIAANNRLNSSFSLGLLPKRILSVFCSKLNPFWK